MKTGRETTRKGAKVGAVLGVIAFLAFGIMPGFYFGSYGALLLMSSLSGGAIEPTVLLRVVTAGGMILGIACFAFMSIVAGTIIGTAVGYGIEMVTGAAREKAPVETATTKTE